jgi:hypothetical protein
MGTIALVADAGFGTAVELIFVCAALVPAVVAAALLLAVAVPGHQGRQWGVLTAASSIGVIWAIVRVLRTGSLPWSYMNDVVDSLFGLALPALITGLLGLPLARLVGHRAERREAALLHDETINQRDQR